MRPTHLAALALLLAGCSSAPSMPQMSSSESTIEEEPLEIEAIGGPRKASHDVDMQDLDPQGRPQGRDRARPARPIVSAKPFEVASLPLADLPAPLREADAPKSLPPGETPPELIIAHNGGKQYDLRLNLAARTVGQIRLGSVSSTSTNGLRVRCGLARKTMVPARWASLTPPAAHDGAAKPANVGRYVVVDAWFDAGSCRATVWRRTSIDLGALPGRVFYGFRSCGESCEESESVTLLGPAMLEVTASTSGRVATSSELPFGVITLELERGGASWVNARIATAELTAWFADKPPSWVTGDELAAGVEIAQTVEDLEPTALAFISR
jgi:hypothetical protein